jgi:hypothetical protein
MNEGVYGGGGFGGQQGGGGGYNDSAKTCYACGGFGMFDYFYLTDAQVTWRKTALKVKSATTAAAWDMSAVTATKPLKPKSATGTILTLQLRI